MRRLVPFGLLCVLGCLPANYQYGRFRGAERPAAADDVVRGAPDATLDAMTSVVEAPARLLPVGPKPPPRDLTPDTATRLDDYLQKNELDGLHIEIRTYDPAGQWRRLCGNARMSPVWRYTAGALNLVGYTLFPGRVYGTNAYNPYTDTLLVNSDRPLDLLKEAATAKDFHARRWPGPYAAVTSLPGLALIRQSRSAADVVGYARAENDWPTERQAYRELYPRVASEGTMAVGPVAGLALGVAWWVHPIIGLGGTAIGHGIGYAMQKRREAERSPAPPPN